MVDSDNNKKDEKDYNRMLFAIDQGNKQCVDCSNEPVTHVSINNGISLCQECATKHGAFGTSISYLRTLNEEWDEYLFNFFIFGSNTKFISSLQLFSIDNSMETEKKYRTVGCDYYRKCLKAKVVGSKPLGMMTFTNGSDLLDNPQDEFPEFQNYQLKSKETKTTMKKVQGFFGKISKKVGEMKIAEKIKTGGVKTWDGMKKAGTFVAEKTAPATTKIKQGANFVSSQVKSAYTDVKGKLIKKNTVLNQDVEVKIANFDQNQDQGQDQAQGQGQGQGQEPNSNDEQNKQKSDDDNKPSELI